MSHRKSTSNKMRIYCAACLNSSLTHPHMSFFKLPTDSERRIEWLKLVDRLDVLDRKAQHTSYRLCEKHFNEADIINSRTKKVLRKKALPFLEPQRLTIEKETQTDIWVETDIRIKTEDTSEDEILPQVSTSFVSDIPIKREFISEDDEVIKRRKLHETDFTQGESKNHFHSLCDKFLNNRLALLIKNQSKPIQDGNRSGIQIPVPYDRDYIIYCLNLYFISPQAYQFSESTLGLPSPSILHNHFFPITTEINDRAMSVFKFKVAQMTDVEKNCSVVIGAMPLKAHVFYNIEQDKIDGFYEVDGLQRPKSAKHALVIMASGIFVNWEQPVSYAFLSHHRSHDEVNEWVHKVIKKLIEIGLNVRMLVYDQISWKPGKQGSVSVEEPYFFINDRKIYYIHDALFLIKNVRKNLMFYDFHFGNRVAKYEHIEQFYREDKKKSIRLAPKLTNGHVKPQTLKERRVLYATQLFSNSVAEGIRMCVENKEIGDSGKDTAILLVIINNLFDSLNTSQSKNASEYKKAYEGNASQKEFFKQMMSFFKDLKLKNPKNGTDVTSSAIFIEGFQITMTSIMLLFDDLQKEGFDFLMTRKCNQDPLENFFKEIKRTTKNTKPSCRMFASAYQNLFICNITKLPAKGNHSDDLGTLPILATDEDSCDALPVPINEISRADYEEFVSIQINRFDYNQLHNIPKTNALLYICGHLLKRCLEKHDDCNAFLLHVKPNQRSSRFRSDSRFSRYRDYCEQNLQSFLVVPSDDFVEYVEKMENIFRNSFQIRHIKYKVAAGIYNKAKDIPLTLPCWCFPKNYLVKLFIRMRIFYTLKYHNTVCWAPNKNTYVFTIADLKDLHLLC